MIPPSPARVPVWKVYSPDELTVVFAGLTVPLSVIIPPLELSKVTLSPSAKAWVEEFLLLYQFAAVLASQVPPPDKFQFKFADAMAISMEYLVPVMTGVIDQPRRVVVTLKFEASPEAKVTRS